jgi:hypothetical protein
MKTPTVRETEAFLGACGAGISHAEAAGRAVEEESASVGVQGDDAVAAAAAEGCEMDVSDAVPLEGVVEGYGGAR